MKRKVNQAVILAAGERKDFDRPVGFLEIEDTTIIDRLIGILKEKGIEKITIVTGYESHYFENLNIKGLELVYSDRYKWTGTMYSLALAEQFIEGGFLLIEGDLIFEERAIDYLLDENKENCLVLVNESGSGDEALVETRNGNVFKISKDMHQLGKIDGEFIGISKISYDAYKDMLLDFKSSKNPYLHYEYVLMNVKDKHSIKYTKIDDLVWSDIDCQRDYEKLKYYIYPKLKRRKSEFKEKYIIQLVSNILGEKYTIKSPIEKLGGMNNDNYRINTNLKDFVFRLPGKGSNESVNRDSELENSRIAHSIGLDCNTIYFDKVSGIKIAEYIEDAETLNITTAKREDNMELIAYALNALHNSEKQFYKDFDPFEEIEEYKKTVISEDSSLLENYKELDSVVIYLKDKLQSLSLEYVPCHLDPWPENFIKGKEKIYLIDWEYSANYDRLWDLVSIALECDYSENQEELFYNKYFGRKPLKEEVEKMNLLRVLMDMYWSMWALSKISCGDKELNDYSLDRYKRGIRNFSKIKHKAKIRR